MLIGATPKIGQPRRHHGPLALVQVTAVKVATDNEAKRIGAGILRYAGHYPCDLTGAIAAAAVEDFALIEHYGIEKAMILDVLNKLVQTVVIEHRKNFGERVELQRGCGHRCMD